LVRLRTLTLLGVVAFSAVALGCANGTYPLDLFYEMHYQQSYSSHEPPRLSVPQGAVPITGVEVPTADNPFSPGERLEDGKQLFMTNCVFCHGPGGRGDGPVLENFMRPIYGYVPIPELNPDLTSSEPGHANAISDIEIYSWITNGFIVMPAFKKLLSEEERWLLVNYIRELQKQ